MVSAFQKFHELRHQRFYAFIGKILENIIGPVGGKLTLVLKNLRNQPGISSTLSVSFLFARSKMFDFFRSALSKGKIFVFPCVGFLIERKCQKLLSSLTGFNFQALVLLKLPFFSLF